MSTGSVTANFHEGSRSEYLAQYVFASFGTAIAVPHHEDTGVDLYCTITERLGRLAWPRTHFTVQVKSSSDAWTFAGKDSVRWLLEHPLPLFLCVVDKKEARLRVYQTSQRLQAGLLSPPPKEVRLRPETGRTGVTFGSHGPADYSLSAPIVDCTLSDLVDDTRMSNARACIKYWAQIDAENILRRRSGLMAVRLPSQYTTNEVPGAQGSTTTFAPNHNALPALLEILEHLALQRRQDSDLTILALLAMLHRELAKRGGRTVPFAHSALNARMGANAYLFDAVDQLIAGVRNALREEVAAPAKAALKRAAARAAKPALAKKALAKTAPSQKAPAKKPGK